MYKCLIALYSSKKLMVILARPEQIVPLNFWATSFDFSKLHEQLLAFRATLSNLFDFSNFEQFLAFRATFEQLLLILATLSNFWLSEHLLINFFWFWQLWATLGFQSNFWSNFVLIYLIRIIFWNEIFIFL